MYNFVISSCFPLHSVFYLPEQNLTLLEYSDNRGFTIFIVTALHYDVTNMDPLPSEHKCIKTKHGVSCKFIEKCYKLIAPFEIDIDKH